MNASKKLFAVAALATAFAGQAFAADTLVAEGFVQPTVNITSTASRADLRADAVKAVRADIADTIAAEGLRADTQFASTQRSRDEVRAEAVQANRANFFAGAQVAEGLVM
jgi:hypothetical protein